MTVRGGTESIEHVEPRRFPAPWCAGQDCRRLRDANGQALAYVYPRDNEDEARQSKGLTKDEARRVAINIERSPELLEKAERD